MMPEARYRELLTAAPPATRADFDRINAMPIAQLLSPSRIALSLRMIGRR